MDSITIACGGQMVKAFSREQIEELRINPYVDAISETQISFTEVFKKQFYEQKKRGIPLRQIFENHGINPDYLGNSRITAISHRINIQAARTEGFRDLRKDNKRKPRKAGTSIDDRLANLECRVAYLEAENDFLKRLRDAEREERREYKKKNLKAETRYEIIAQLLIENNAINLVQLCEHAQVSRSGYYRWLHEKENRKRREIQDEQDYALILEAYRYRGYDKGARGIHMRLLRFKPQIVMNLKKIRRLMKKFGLKCPIRKANPARRMAKAIKTNNTAPNRVNQEFAQKQLRKVLLTDITYIPYNGTFCYLSPVIDVCSDEVLAYNLSESLELPLVLDMLESLLVKYGAELDNDTIIHSDQGCHYTSNSFIQKLKQNDLQQSMSRKGNCWDNAPQESFFGHMKDEIKDKIKACHSFQEVKVIIDDWIDYYNNDRPKWELNKLTPREYAEYLRTGNYPLQVLGKSKNPNSSHQIQQTVGI